MGTARIKLCQEILKGRDSLEKLVVNGWIILKYIFDEKYLSVFLCISIDLVLNMLSKYTIILPVALYGCEILSLALKEDHRLRVFENRVLRRMFGAKKDEVTGGWRKLHNEELHNLYCSPSIIRIIKSRRMRWGEQLARMGKDDCM
jgi:hypothetical protein